VGQKGRSSRNSSQPASSHGPGQHGFCSCSPCKVKDNGQRSKRGGQQGHPLDGRVLTPSAICDEALDHYPDQCGAMTSPDRRHPPGRACCKSASLSLAATLCLQLAWGRIASELVPDSCFHSRSSQSDRFFSGPAGGPQASRYPLPPVVTAAVGHPRGLLLRRRLTPRSLLRIDRSGRQVRPCRWAKPKTVSDRSQSDRGSGTSDRTQFTGYRSLKQAAPQSI